MSPSSLQSSCSVAQQTNFAQFATPKTSRCSTTHYFRLARKSNLIPSNTRYSACSKRMNSIKVMSSAGNSPTNSNQQQQAHSRREPRSDAYSGSHSSLSSGGKRQERPAKRSVTSLPSYAESLHMGQTMDSPGILEDSVGMLWNFYCRSLERHPLATKAVVMALGLACGDVLAKCVTGVFDDVWRTFSMGLFGLLFQGPALHFLYKSLDANIMPSTPTAPRAVIAKTAIDQIIFAPIATAAFIGSMELLSGSPGAVTTAISNRLVSTLTASYTIWPLALLFNYAFCPAQHRIIFVNVVTILWSMILSIITT